MITSINVKYVFNKSVSTLRENSAYLIELDQQLGDGDLGLTARKIADALEEYLNLIENESDIGKILMTAGMKINSAASSTMGSLLAIAMMRAGKISKEKSELDNQTLSDMLQSAAAAIQEKGKANLGDKTILDALIPAVDAFSTSISDGSSLNEAGKKMLAAAEAGLKFSTPLRSKVGRASWVGDRTEGKIDPGCALLVCLLEGVIN